MKILHQNCDPKMAKDKTLPLNSYLVTYLIDGAVAYDIVISHKKVEIFDHYWDNYRTALKAIKWTDGTVNPKLWGNQVKTEKKK